MTAIFRGSVTSDDWTFGKGKSDYLRDDLAIAKDIKTKLLTFRGECFFDPEIGVRWFSLLGQKTKEVLATEIQAVILNVDGVMRVTNLNIQLSDTRELMLKYWIDTVNSTGVAGSIAL